MIQRFTVHEQARPIDILCMKDDDLYEMTKSQRVVFPILVYYFQMFPTDFPEILTLLNSSLCSRQNLPFFFWQKEPQILVNIEAYRKLLLPGIYPIGFFSPL